MAAEVGLRVANVFHAGDGNLHPLVLYDRSIPGQEEIAVDLSMRILTSAWTMAGRLPGSTAWAGRSSRRWGICTPSRTSIPCNGCAAASTRTILQIPISCFPRPRLCGGKDRANILLTRWRQQASQSSFDQYAGHDRILWLPSLGRSICGARDGDIGVALRQHGRGCGGSFAWPMRTAARGRDWGGGTKQGWGYPVAPALVLEMQRLNVLREHTWQDMTCTVEAGCTWAALQSGLAEHGQYVALDPLWPEQATVGGIVATNDSGALRLKYGGLRDLIIGMTIVLADGTIARTGGKVVKNVAGYDLHKLMIGAFGTLGVITSVNFRLHPLPADARTWSFACLGAGCRTAGKADAQGCCTHR